MTRKSRGRQKIEMTRMSKESNLLVTFSKRRSGLFKKASELCTLCGAEIGIIIFSPGKKAFSFGHPSVESILKRFLSIPPSQPHPPNLPLVEAHRSASVKELNTQLNELMGQMAEEKTRGEELSRTRKAAPSYWWEAPIDQMGLEELEQLKAAMEELRKNVSRHAAMAPPLPFLGMALPGASAFDVVETKANVVNPVAGLGQLSLTPHGYTLGSFGHSFF